MGGKHCTDERFGHCRKIVFNADPPTQLDILLSQHQETVAGRGNSEESRIREYQHGITKLGDRVGLHCENCGEL